MEYGVHCFAPYRPGFPVATDVVAHLSDRHGYGAIKDGENDTYGDDALYEKRRADDWGFRDTWEAFRSEIRFRARFFSTYAGEALTSIRQSLPTQLLFAGKVDIVLPPNVSSLSSQ